MSAPDFTNPEHLTQVLLMLSANSTETIKQGESFLKPFSKNPASIAAYMSQITSCSNEICRHQASLMLKKNICKHFEKFSATDQSALKSAILNMFISEPSRSIQTALAG